MSKSSIASNKINVVALSILIVIAAMLVYAIIRYSQVASQFVVKDNTTPRTANISEESPDIKQDSAKTVNELKSETSYIFRKLARKAEKVYISGDFNGWKKEQMEKNNRGEWEIRLKLNPGQYSYFFIVDGKEQPDDFNISVKAGCRITTGGCDIKKSGCKGNDVCNVSIVDIK